jgi:hypothetical protein
MDESNKRLSGERSRQARAEYELGLAFFGKKQWKTAARHFRLADEKSPRNDPAAHLYRSYHGLSLIYCADVSGLNLCRNAAARDNRTPEVFFNLTLAELRFNHRKRACGAITQGLRIDPRHNGLLKLRDRIGVRRQPCVSFLKRDNPVNKWLGKVTYRQAKRRAPR